MFTLPTFNLGVNIWRWGAIGGPPTLITVGNLALGHREYPGFFTGSLSHLSTYTSAVSLLLPPLTDVRDSSCVGGLADVVEVPAGSGRTYLVLSVEDAGKGFTNEHRVAMLGKMPAWPAPIP